MNQLGRTHTLEALKELEKKSTQVVGWYSNYANLGQVRGPFGRWITVSDVAPPYSNNVADVADDARYIEAAINMVPYLIEDIEKLQEKIKQLETEIGIEKDLLR